jgi:hypothetical protein
MKSKAGTVQVAQTRTRPEPALTSKVGTDLAAQTLEVIEPTLVTNWARLLVAVEILEDLQGLRLATASRLREIESRNVGSTKNYEKLFTFTRSAERKAKLEIEHAMAEEPLGKWALETPGIGAFSVGRLIATTGDPATRNTISQYWSYCGLAVKDGRAPRPKRGEPLAYSPRARSIIYNMAEATVKNKKSAYRSVYDAGREQYAEVEHLKTCPLCGTKGNPAEPGTPLRLSHQHKRAMRLVMKAITRDIWLVAKGIENHGD